LYIFIYLFSSDSAALSAVRAVPLRGGGAPPRDEQKDDGDGNDGCSSARVRHHPYDWREERLKTAAVESSVQKEQGFIKKSILNENLEVNR
jgi:hypothetical protein